MLTKTLFLTEKTRVAKQMRQWVWSLGEKRQKPVFVGTHACLGYYIIDLGYSTALHSIYQITDQLIRENHSAFLVAARSVFASYDTLPRQVKAFVAILVCYTETYPD